MILLHPRNQIFYSSIIPLHNSIYYLSTPIPKRLIRSMQPISPSDLLPLQEQYLFVVKSLNFKILSKLCQGLQFSFRINPVPNSIFFLKCSHSHRGVTRNFPIVSYVLSQIFITPPLTIDQDQVHQICPKQLPWRLLILSHLNKVQFTVIFQNE